MKQINEALVLYFTLCIVVVVSFIFKYDTFGAIVKMFLVPIIFYYYYINTKKINWLLTSILFFCFIGNILGMFEVFVSNVYIMMIPFFISYVLFLLLGIQDITKIKIKKLEFVIILLVTVFMFYIYFNVINLLTDDYKGFFVSFSIYGFVLVLAAIISTINILFNNRSYDLYYLFVILCFMISDIFYVINNFYFLIIAFQILGHTLEVLSFYLIVKYILSRENYSEEIAI